MAYDEKLADRVRKAIPPRARVTEKKMFGGLAFLLDGKMFIGVNAVDLMVRVGPDAYQAALKRPHVRLMDFTGRPLTGYIYVSAAGSRSAASVAGWVRQSMHFVGTLPAKKRKPARRGS